MAKFRDRSILMQYYVRTKRPDALPRIDEELAENERERKMLEVLYRAAIQLRALGMYDETNI